MKIHEIFRQSKITFALAYPVMLSQLGQVMVGVADSVMVGRIGKESLAGASLGNSVFVLFLTFGIGISYGITPLVAKADGEKNAKAIFDLLKNGFAVNLVTALLLFCLLILTSYIFPYLNQPNKVVELSIPYFIVISISIIPFMVFQTFRQFAEGLSMTRQAMVITVTGNMINILLNYILIYGKAGFPTMGLFGAGIATLISRIIMGISMIIFIYKGKRFKIFWQNFEHFDLNKKIIRKILAIGLPSGLQFLFEVGAFSFAAIMVGWMGTIALAAHQIAISLASITYMMATGIATATMIRVGNQLGKHNVSMLRKVGYTGFILGATFMGINAVLLICLNNFLPTLYITDNEVILFASKLILIAAFFQISDGLQVVSLGALRGMSDVKIPTFITLIAYWVLALPIGYILGIMYNLGPIGIWTGLLIGLSVTAVLLMYRFYRISYRINPDYS